MSICAALSSGCLVLTLHPVYDEASIDFDPALVGDWRDPESGGSIVIQRAEWRSYRVTFAEATTREELTGYLTTIGRERFLDVMPERGKDYSGFLVPVHAAYRVQMSPDTLTVSGLNFDWFESAAKRRRLRGLEYAFDEKKNVVLTSPTPALRAWLAGHVQSAEAFGPPATFQRVK